mgnify:CR=1 FL=1|tara:strand:- start:221 stop:406 length:186 start_codon:yes stop_codon:yes gene_type:complete
MSVKQITIEVDGEKSVYTLEGDKAEKLETTIGAFEDVLATHFEVDPMVNSLDIVDAVAIND